MTDSISAAIVVIGNEILSGRTRDANIQFLARALGDMGVRVREVRVVSDEEPAIVAAVNACRSAYDYVFTTGGIGPTHDDITAASIAKAFNTQLHLHPEAIARLNRYYGESDLNQARLRMAAVPEGADLIDNPISTSPGFRLGNVFVLAGVPRIAQAMFDGLRHRLKTGQPVIGRTVTAFLREGDIAEPLAALQDRYPDLDIGSYPFVRNDRIGTSIVCRGTDPARAEAAAAEVATVMRAAGADPLPGDLAADTEPL